MLSTGWNQEEARTYAHRLFPLSRCLLKIAADVVIGYLTSESSVFECIALQVASWSSVLEEGYIMGPSSYYKASNFLDWESTGFPDTSLEKITG